MLVEKSRIISLTLAGIFYLLGILFLFETVKDFVLFFMYLFFCISLIWHGDEFGSLTGIRFGSFFDPHISRTSPGCVVRFLGWCLLIVPLLLITGRLLFLWDF